MKYLAIILTLLIEPTFAQSNIDTLHAYPSDLNSFNFETTGFNDITVFKIEISEMDTVSKEVIAQYKLNSKGQILAKKSIFRKYSYLNDTSFQYYTYKYYPIIYSINSWENGEIEKDFESYSIDKLGHLENYNVYSYIDGANSWCNSYFSEKDYNNKGQLIKTLTKYNDAQDVSETKIEYFDNGHIKNRTTCYKYSKRTDKIKYVNLYIDSNDCSYYQSPSPEKVQRHETIYYNGDGTISSEKYFWVAPYSELKNDTTYFERKYEYDSMKRLIKCSNISLDINGKEIGGQVNLYIYNTKQKPNFAEIEDKNGM